MHKICLLRKQKLKKEIIRPIATENLLDAPLKVTETFWPATAGSNEKRK